MGFRQITVITLVVVVLGSFVGRQRAFGFIHWCARLNPSMAPNHKISDLDSLYRRPPVQKVDPSSFWKHLWSGALCSDWNHETVNAPRQDESPPEGCLGSASERGDIQREAGVEPRQLCVGKGFRHLSRMPPGCLPMEVSLGRSNKEETMGHTQNLIIYLICPECLRKESLESVSAERDVWNTVFNLLPPQPDPG